MTHMLGSLPWVTFSLCWCAGLPGRDGLPGHNGTDGIHGLNGVPGADGKRGKRGTVGVEVCVCCYQSPRAVRGYRRDAFGATEKGPVVECNLRG